VTDEKGREERREGDPIMRMQIQRKINLKKEHPQIEEQSNTTEEK